MTFMDGILFGTRLPFKQTLQVNEKRIFSPRDKWFMSGRGQHLRAFGYERGYADSTNLFASTQLCGKLDLLQLVAFITGLIFLSRSTGGELLNVAALVSLFEPVAYTSQELRNNVSRLDLSDRLLYRGVVGKENAVDVMHDSELAITLSILLNFILAIIAALGGRRCPALRDGLIRVYHASLLIFYCLSYVEKAFNYKLAAVISIIVETQVFSGRISDRAAAVMLGTGIAIRLVKFISFLAGNAIFAELSSAACLFNTHIARKVLHGTPSSREEICSRMYLSRQNMCGVLAEQVESTIVTRISFNGPPEGSIAHFSHELLEEFDDPDESCMSAIVGVKTADIVCGTYDTITDVIVPDKLVDVKGNLKHT